MRLIDADTLDIAFTMLRFDEYGNVAHWDDRKNWCLEGSDVEKLIADAPTVDALVLTDQEKNDLEVIHRIRSGSIKKIVCRDYAIYNGDWYREHPWNVPKEHKPHILGPDEFGMCGIGWLEYWSSPEYDGGEKPSEVFFELCAWCGKTLTTNEFLISLEPGDMMIEYGKAGGFRVWAGDFAPSEETRKEAAWHA